MTDEAHDVVVQGRKGVSLVWIIPLIAALLGAWLWWQAHLEEGPTVTIAFETADGLEAGKTRIKFKNVDLGEVHDISIAEDLSGVVVTAEIDRMAEHYLCESTRFWVVRPRIGTTGVSGLGTLVSGAYIEMEPSATGQPSSSFVGLEEPPVSPADAPGLKFTLTAGELGSLGVGSSIYYRGIQVGQVEDHELAEDHGSVTIAAYVEEPYAALVRENTRFWNASGIEVELGAGGLSIRTQALDSVLLGGVAFGVPADEAPGEPASSGCEFKLYASQQASREDFSESNASVMYFSGSVRGLEVGAPVEFRGIQVGEVAGISLELDTQSMEALIPVIVHTQPERLHRRGDPSKKGAVLLPALIERGLRARLATGSLVTGALFIELDLHPDTEVVYHGDGSLPEIPTIPSTSETLASAVNDVTQVVEDVRQLVAALEERAPALVDDLRATSEAARAALGKVDAFLAEGALLQQPVVDALAEFSSSLRAVRLLAEYLERHPEALIQGKDEGAP